MSSPSVTAMIGPGEGEGGVPNVVVAIALNPDTSNIALAKNALQANTFPGLQRVAINMVWPQ